MPVIIALCLDLLYFPPCILNFYQVIEENTTFYQKENVKSQKLPKSVN